MSKDMSDDEELQIEAKDGGKASKLKAEMLEQLAAWGITSTVIKKVSKGDTKTDMPKILSLRAFYNVACETQFDYGTRPWSDIRLHFSNLYSFGLPEAEPTDRTDNWQRRVHRGDRSDGQTYGDRRDGEGRIVSRRGDSRDDRNGLPPVFGFL